MCVSHYFNRTPLSPFPNIFWWAYLIPILIGAVNGLSHLREVPLQGIDLIGVVYLDSKSYLTGLIIKPLFIVVCSWMLGTAVLNSKKPEKFIMPLICSPVLPALAIIFFVMLNGFDIRFLASDRSRTVLSVLGMHANEFGLLLGTSFALILFLLPATQGKVEKFWMITCLSIITIALLLTFSRGGYMIAFVAVITFLILQKKTRYILIFSLVLCIFGLLAPGVFWERITTGVHQASARDISGANSDALTAGRFYLWQNLFPEFWKSPLWGSGVGSTAWSSLVKKGHTFVNHPHNLYLRILLDLGLMGMVLLTLFVRFILRNVKKVADDQSVPKIFSSLARGTQVALIGFLLAGMANGQYISESELSILWLSIGILLPLMVKQEKAFQVSSGTAERKLVYRQR